MDLKANSKKEKVKLNVLLIQYSPLTKKVNDNFDKVGKMLENYSIKDQIDIIVLPEMSFTGYIFDDKNDIKCCLEEQGKGPAFKFCSDIAKKYK